MLEFHKKHKRGKKTFFFLFATKGWWLLLAGTGVLYVSLLMYAGSLRPWVNGLLAARPELYGISAEMFAGWFALVGISFFIVAFLFANVEHKYYKFILDEYAVHLHRGLFFVQETTIPYEQITNVHIARPVLYRLFGVAKLDIVTAADKDFENRESRTKKFLLPMIDTALARTLARQLLECASRSRKGKHVYAEEAEDADILDEDESDEESEEAEG